MRPDELPFVAAGWKRSAQDAPQNEQIPAPEFFARMNRLVDQLLAREGVTVLVARDAERPSVLFGFACIETRGDTMALHYAYTRHSHRRLGVCVELLKHALDNSDAELLVYTVGSRFDRLWEKWGFDRVDLGAWLRGEAA
jgi:hypothetical protein